MDEMGPILTKLGEMSSDIKHLRDDMSTICEFKDELQKVAQEFRDYKETRKDLPIEISDTKEKVTACQTSCQHHVAKTEEYFKKTDYLMTWSHKISGILIAINVLVGAIIVLVELGIIKPW